MTQTDREQRGRLRLGRHAGDEVLSRWKAGLDAMPLGGERKLQLEVLSTVTNLDTARRRRGVPRLASQLCEQQPELGDLVHQLSALRQVLHAVLSESLDAAEATEAQRRVNSAIDRLVEACTKATTERLTAAACVDPLTGLRNRHALERDLPERIALATRGNRPLTVVVADLDGLKQINDRDGHGAGDLALRAMGSALDSVLRAGDTAYRIGGDEFLLVLPDANADVADAVVGRVGRSAPSFGWGAATLPADGTDAAGLIERADERLLGGRRNARRPHADAATARRPGPARGQGPRRALAAAALAAAGALGGGLAFAADGVIGGPQELIGGTVGPSHNTARTGSAETSGTSAGPTTSQAGDTGAHRGLAGPEGAAGGTTTGTARLIAALIGEAAVEPPALPIPLPDAGVVTTVEQVQPPDVPDAPEVPGVIDALEPDLDPDSSTKAQNGRPKPEKPRETQSGASKP